MEHPIDDVIRRRRNRKSFNGSPVPREIVVELLELAILAPMHRLTNPWHFWVLDQAAIQRLCAWWSDPTELRAGAADPDLAQRKAEIYRNKIAPQVGAVVVVTAQRHNEAIVAALSLGRPTSDPKIPPRQPLEEVTTWL